MEIRPLPPEDRRDLTALAGFLEDCAGRARARGRAQLVSISLPVEHIDPLAVLESIDDPAHAHVYLEWPERGEAFAGARPVAEVRAEGPGRFDAVRRWHQSLLEDTVAVGPAGVIPPGGGPRACGAFSFQDHVPAGAPFPAAWFFVPQWQVVQTTSGAAAVANAMVQPESGPAECRVLAGLILRAHARFGSFDYTSAHPEPAAPVWRAVHPEDAGAFEAAVHGALAAISRGEFEKIVLAREVVLEADSAVAPLRVAARLRRRYPSCHVFSVGNGAGAGFIGASPERLLEVDEVQMRTEAIAGTAARADGAAADARLGSGLLKSDKNGREHGAVVASVIKRLQAAGLDPRPPARPRLLQLPNVQHLYVAIEAPRPHGLHLLDVAAHLHPTPAVGGKPRMAVVPRIREFETFDRGLYAGALGWLEPDGGGRLVVGLRSGLLKGRTVRLYAGVGIVAGSEPAEEWHETVLKLAALREALG